MVIRFIKRIKLFIFRFFKKDPLFVNKYVEIIPEKMKSDILYIEGGYQSEQFASLLCPCGCKEVINLNLEPEENPCWVLKKGRLTDLSPSIWKSSNCKSHFFIKRGKIRWCKENN
jgi:hypothetical protein